MSQQMQQGDGGDPDLSTSRCCRSLGRGLAVLRLFTPARPVLGVAEIANLLGLTPATAHRYVTTLSELGYLERNRSRKYQLSLRVLDLGRPVLGATPPVHARPVLEQFRTTGYTASLGVLDGADVLLLGRAASTRRGSHLIPNSAIGTRLPTHCTSMGKVLLATLPDETWRSRLGDSRLEKHGPGTITSKSRFDLQLRNVRKRGYATSNQELWPEVLAVAVPVLDAATTRSAAPVAMKPQTPNPGISVSSSRGRRDLNAATEDQEWVLSQRALARTRTSLAGDVAHLYVQEKQHANIGEALNLTKSQVHKILSELFVEGMPKLERRRSDERARAIHGAFVRGERSIGELVELVEKEARKPARSRAHAEQRVITALLMARVDELRRPRALSLERLAFASDVSWCTLQRLRSQVSDPRLSTVLRLCRGLGVTAGELLDDLPLPVEPRPSRVRTPAQAGTDT